LAEVSDQVREKAKRDAHLVRGVVLNHYATVEYGVDELLYRCRRYASYRKAIPLRLPRSMSDKIALVRNVVALPGPLRPFGDNIASALDRLDVFTVHRHLAAHGRLAIEFPESGPVMRLEKFRVKGSELGQDVILLDQQAIHTLTQQLSICAATTTDIIDTAIRESGLASLEEPDA